MTWQNVLDDYCESSTCRSTHWKGKVDSLLLTLTIVSAVPAAFIFLCKEGWWSLGGRRVLTKIWAILPHFTNQRSMRGLGSESHSVSLRGIYRKNG